MNTYFNLLPRETQYEIYKRYPQFRTLSSQHYKEEQLYYNQYCDLPISKNEFINYIKTSSNFVLYVVGENDYHETYTVYHFSKTFGRYLIDIIKIYVDQVDEGEYIIKKHDRHKIVSANINTKNNIFEFIDELGDFNYDIVTMVNILSKRDCETIKPGYAKNYAKKYLNIQDENIETLEGLYQHLKTTLYLLSNNNMLNDQNINLNVYDSLSLIYDHNSNLIDDTDLPIYYQEIGSQYENALQKLNDYLE